LRSERYFGAIHFLRAITIHPLNYALKLAAAAERDGARIFEGTPALAIDPTGVRKRISTPAARVRASHVVLAGNVQLRGLLPRVAATLVPITTYVITTAPIDRDRLSAAVNYRGAVSDTDLADNHYRVVGGDRLMWAGAGGFWPGNPRGAARQFKRAIARIFPQLGPVEIEHAWSGVMGYSLHGLPQVGEVIPGLWVANGFGRHGLNTAAMAGELVATAITEHDDRWRLFLPYELVWAGGRLGRLVRHVGVWSLERGEDWTASVARRREAIRRAEGEAEEVQDGQELVAAPEPPSGAPHTLMAQTVADRPDRGSSLVPEAAIAAVDVPEVESLLRQAAERARGAHRQPDEAGSEAFEAESPPFGRNSEDS
jgi:hypothetical protein